MRYALTFMPRMCVTPLNKHKSDNCRAVFDPFKITDTRYVLFNYAIARPFWKTREKTRTRGTRNATLSSVYSAIILLSAYPQRLFFLSLFLTFSLSLSRFLNNDRIRMFTDTITSEVRSTDSHRYRVALNGAKKNSLRGSSPRPF